MIQWTNLDLEFADFANVDLVICVGSHFIQRKVLERSKSETLVSGYNYFDIYIESDKHMDFIRKIVSLNLNLNLYVKEGIKNDFDNVIWVSDLDEAIGQLIIMEMDLVQLFLLMIMRQLLSLLKRLSLLL